MKNIKIGLIGFLIVICLSGCQIGNDVMNQDDETTTMKGEYYLAEELNIEVAELDVTSLIEKDSDSTIENCLWANDNTLIIITSTKSNNGNVQNEMYFYDIIKRIAIKKQFDFAKNNFSVCWHYNKVVSDTHASFYSQNIISFDVIDLEDVSITPANDKRIVSYSPSLDYLVEPKVLDYDGKHFTPLNTTIFLEDLVNDRIVEIAKCSNAGDIYWSADNSIFACFINGDKEVLTYNLDKNEKVIRSLDDISGNVAHKFSAFYPYSIWFTSLNEIIVGAHSSDGLHWAILQDNYEDIKWNLSNAIDSNYVGIWDDLILKGDGAVASTILEYVDKDLVVKTFFDIENEFYTNSTFSPDKKSIAITTRRDEGNGNHSEHMYIIRDK